MHILVMALSVAGAIPPLQEAPKPTPIDAANWVTADDYPAAALRASEQGIVHVRLSVNEAGMPAGCEVATSSGSAVLDEATCKLLSQRGRFRPALGADGKPVASTFERRVKWQIPEGGASFQPIANIRMTVIADVAADGALLGCKTERLASEALTQAQRGEWDYCDHLPKSDFARLAAGKPTRILYEDDVRIAGLPPLPEPDRTGTEIVAREAVRFKLGADGRPVDCEMIATRQDRPPLNPCSMNLPGWQQMEALKLEFPVTIQISRTTLVAHKSGR